MRHFLTSGSVTMLALSMFETTPPATLIASSGLFERFSTGQICTGRPAIDITPVTVTADGHLAVAADTVVETCGVLHRQQ